MANKQRKREDGMETFSHAITAADVIYIGDMVGRVSGKAVPASDFTYGGGGTYGTLAAAQAAFRDVFLGVSRQASRSSDDETVIVVDGYGIFEFDCASASFAVGDLVGPTGNTTPTPDALSDQSVVAVSDPALAIGRVFKATSSETKVRVKIFSTLLEGGVRNGSFGALYTVAFNVAAAEIANGNVVTGFKPKHRFKIAALDATVTSALTGSSKTVTLNAEIDAVDVTGGVLVVASANAAIGTCVEGSAITALDEGTLLSVIDIEASSVTAFTGGTLSIQLRLRNLSV